VEVVKEVAGAEFALAAQRIVQPSASEAKGQPAEHAQDRQGPGRAHPAAIFIESGVQALMARFDAPVAATAPQQFTGWPLSGIGTGDQRPGSLCRGRVVFAGRAPQLPDLAGGHKADLLRSGVLQPQLALLAPAPVLFAGLRLLERRMFPREKRRQGTTVR